MSHYKINDKDVHFTLFDHLKIQDLCQLEAFKEHNQELYEMIVNEGIKFAQNELSPLNSSGDKEGCRIEAGEVTTPKGFKEAYAKLAQNGFIGIDVPTTYGGQGLPVVLFLALNEFFIGANSSFTLYSGLSRGSAFLIETFGSDELKSRFCEKMYSGTWAGTMCLTEPQAGTAVGDLRTSAKKNDDGTYNIVGNKIFITAGNHDLTDNIIHLVLARVEGDPEGSKGISLFVVPKIWVKEDGSLGEANDVACVNIEHKMGIKASATCALNFGENNKCRGYLVGEQTQGLKYMFQMMNEARILCGMQGMALAGTATENAISYAKEREQGGKTLIVDYPDVRRNIMLSKSLTEGMRALLLYTAKVLDQAHNESDGELKERMQNRADLMTPIAKAFCSDQGFRVTELGVQILGGYGYCDEYPLEQYLRDVKIASIYEGTNGVQALDLVGRKLAMKQGLLFKELYEDLSGFVSKNESNGRLKAELDDLKKALDTIAQVAMKIAEWGMSGDRIKPQIAATPCLEMCGHLCSAWLLLEQALIAQDKIGAGQDEPFYRNKIRTAQFYVRHHLPAVRMRAKEILSEDMSLMEVEL